LQEDFEEVVAAAQGFAYQPERPEGRNFVEQKWGWSAKEPGGWAGVWLSVRGWVSGQGLMQAAWVKGWGGSRF